MEKESSSSEENNEDVARTATPAEEAQEAIFNNNAAEDAEQDTDTPDHHRNHEQLPPKLPSITLQQQQQPSNQQHKQPYKPLTPSPATTPEPTTSSSSGPSSSSILTSWYSLTSGGSSGDVVVTTQDSKTYRAYVQSIDKCLKNFEYSIEWPDLISALTKLNKVISSFNTTIATQQSTQQSSSTSQPPPPPLPRTTLITKRLSQCLHPNLPSGVHLKTLETFDLIFKGFKPHDYIHLESDLFSFTSGLLPLWSYAAISVKPKLLSLYENHLVELGPRLKPALPGIMLSLFNGLVDDGVEQDIKIRIQTILLTLQKTNPSVYTTTLLQLISSHPSIHLPVLTHITTQINYTPPPPTLMHLISSPNTLVQRNALELLKSYNMESLPHPTQVKLTQTVLQSLLKRDMSITRRVFTFIEPRQDLVIKAIDCLIQDPHTDGHSLTRILSSILDNQNINILDEILPPVVKYLMKCEYKTSVAFLSTISSSYLSSHFTNYLFQADQLEELEKRVIIFNYIVKLRLFDFDWERFFTSLQGMDDNSLRVILQMVRLHYNAHQDSFIPFYNDFMSKYFDLPSLFERVLGVCCHSDVSDWFGTSNKPDVMESSVNESVTFQSTSFEFVCELMQKSNPAGSELCKKYIVLSACVATNYTDHCVQTYIKFQDVLQEIVYNTRATFLVFKHCYDNNKGLLDSLRYPEKYLLSELHSDRELREVIKLDLTSSPLVVLKLVDPTTMGRAVYRRFIAKEFVRGSPSLVLSSILKYLEFQVDNNSNPGNNSKKDLFYYSRAKSESNLLISDGGDEVDQEPLGHANSVVSFKNNGASLSPPGGAAAAASSSCYYDSARVSTLLEKLEFVIDVHEEFLKSIDLVVLLSKLTVLSTIQNCNESESVTLEIQTRALRLIGRIVKGYGEVSHSFVYDSLLLHLNGRVANTTELEVLWELAAVDVICEFFRFDLENYTLALVVQKCLSSSNHSDNRELEESVHVRWLRGIGAELGRLRKHFNAVVLISFTNVCRNLLEGDKGWSDWYGGECVGFLNVLMRFVLSGYNKGQDIVSSGGGFLSSLFGGSVAKDNVVDEREALRTALLGKVDLVLRICCKWWRKRSVVNSGLGELVKYLGEGFESEVMGGVLKCFDVVALEFVCRELLGLSGGKVCGVIIGSNDKVVEGINFLVRYLKLDRNVLIDVGSIVSVCKLGGSCRHTLMLVTEYLRCGGGSNVTSKSTGVGKELQDLVVRTIEMGVEKREFWVLESYVPGIFDLVWGGGGNTGDGVSVSLGGDGESLSSSLVVGGSSASSASVRDQKIIVSTVHGVVVAVLVAVKGSITSQSSHETNSIPSANTTSAANNYTSALKVLEQISHHTYLRKAWKKEIFDLITNEPTFFYFTPECLAIWKVIVDNLFTQDRSTFSELITRLTQTTQLSTSALSIFSSKDSEVYETRASLLKRLAFVIHSSEKDQYAKYITNIQEKIAEALKIGGGGGGGATGSSSTNTNNANSSSSNNLSSMSLNYGIYDQLGGGGNNSAPSAMGVSNSVFLCFRIMVLKFNANILVSLWPIIVHEVVLVLNSLQSHLDDLTVYQAAQQQEESEQLPPPPPPPHSLLSLYLQTLKLLNFLFTIPSSDSQIPHFQLYKWAFTESNQQPSNEEELNNNDNQRSCVFTPYISKLRNTALSLFPDLRMVNVPPLRIKRVGSVEELCGAFGYLDSVVGEGEWEVVDFCDGCSSNHSGGYSGDDNVGNTDL